MPSHATTSMTKQNTHGSKVILGYILYQMKPPQWITADFTIDVFELEPNGLKGKLLEYQHFVMQYCIFQW